MDSLQERLNFNLNDETFKKFTPVFIQTCLIPRMTLEPAEAIYCAKFLIKMFKIEQMKRNTIINRIQSIVLLIYNYLQCSTENESSCIAIFLLEIFKIFKDWNNREKLSNHLVELFNCKPISSSQYEQVKLFIMNKIFDKCASTIRMMKNNLQQVVNSLQVLFKLKGIFPPIKGIAYKIAQHLKQVKQMYPKTKYMQIHIRIDAYLM